MNLERFRASYICYFFFLIKYFQYDTREVTSKYYDKLLLNLSQFTLASSTLQSKQLQETAQWIIQCSITDFLEERYKNFLPEQLLNT